MVTTKIVICNMALSMCGTRRIEALSDPSREARACNDNYDACRRAVLRRHKWNFATKRDVLDTVSGDAPAFGFTYTFPLPDDFIRIHTVFDTGLSVLDEGQYRVEGLNLVADNDELWLKYIYDVEDTNKFDPLFDQYLAAMLADAISPQLNASSSNLNDIRARLVDAKRAAAFVDATEDPSEELDMDVWLRARVGVNSGFVRDPMT